MIIIEKKALAKVFNDGDILFFLKLKEEYFININLRKIYQNLYNYVAKYNKIPDLKFFKNKLKGKLGSSSPLVAMLDSFEDMKVGESEKELLDSLHDAYKVHKVDEIIPMLTENAKEKNLDELKTNLLKLENTLFTDDKQPTDIMEEIYTPSNIKLVEAFLPEMRKRNLYFGGLSIIGGSSGGGKSLFLLNQLIYNYEVNNENVCLLNFELGTDDVIQRIYSFKTDTPYSEIYGNKDPQIIQKINQWKSEFFNRENKFYISDKPMNIDEVEKTIRAFHKKGVDIFGIDYLNIVETNSHQDEWKSLSTFVKRLHRLTKELGIVIISPTQVNMTDVKEKDNKLTITTRGSREIEFSSSVLIFVYRTKEEYEQNTARIFTIKARNAEPKTYVVETDFKHMRFIDTGLSI